MIAQEDLLKELKALAVKQDYQAIAGIVSQEAVEREHALINGDLSFEVNGILAVLYWNLGKPDDCLRICDRMLDFFDASDDMEYDEYMVSGIIALKYRIMMQRGEKLRAHFFLKRHMEFLSGEEIWVRQAYEQAKDDLVDRCYVRIGYAYVALVFLYALGQRYFRWVQEPYSTIVLVMLIVVIVLGGRKNSFVKKALSRIF